MILLFNDAISTVYAVPNCRVALNDELETVCKNGLWYILRYYPSICLKVQRKTTRIVTLDRRVSNLVHEAGVITTWPRQGREGRKQRMKVGYKQVNKERKICGVYSVFHLKHSNARSVSFVSSCSSVRKTECEASRGLHSTCLKHRCHVQMSCVIDVVFVLIQRGSNLTHILKPLTLSRDTTDVRLIYLI